MAEFPGLGHVAVTVSDLDGCSKWYETLFGASPVIDEDTGPYHHVVWALPGGTLFGIHKHPSTPKGDTFSEFRVGLDHLSFHCASRKDLEAWKKHLDEMGAPNGGIVDAPYGSGLSFRDPDGNALEFFAPPNS